MRIFHYFQYIMADFSLQLLKCNHSHGKKNGKKTRNELIPPRICVIRCDCSMKLEAKEVL